MAVWSPDPEKPKRWALAPAVEVYSIDEAFLDVTGLSRHHSLIEFGCQVRETIDRWVGLQVCVGIAPSKTLAKLANHAAKQYPKTGGVVDLSDPARQRRLLTLLPVGEVWGVGRKLAQRFELREAIASYLSRAMEKLRREHQTARSLQVFIRTSPFREQDPQYSNAATGQLAGPTADTRPMLALAMALLDRLWQPGFRYAKAGVMLSDFYGEGSFQPDLLNSHQPGQRQSDALMGVLDEINASGLGKIWLARQGAERGWTMKREHLSPGYTTRWSELARVR